MTTILIVEDEAIIAEDLRETLQGLDYRVCAIADTAVDAIRLASEHRPEVVLMDIFLKGGPDGIEAAATISRDLHLPIIFLTAHADPATFARAKAVKPAAYLYKPFDKLSLQTTLEIALERHRIEQELAASERRYRSLFDMSKDAILLVDQANGLFLDCNPAVRDLYGYSRQELIGQRADLLSNEPDKTLRAIQEGHMDVPLRWHKKKDGTVFPVAITSCTFTLDNLPVILSSIRDISDRIRAETALRAAEERWNLALSGAGDGVWDWNPVSDQLYVSPQCETMLGYEAGTMARSSAGSQALIHPDDREQCLRLVGNLLTGVSATLRSEHRLRCGDGAYKWVLVRGKIINTDAEHRPLRVVGTMVDISERKRLESELLEKETFLQTIIESAPECITLHQRDGSILSMNRAGLVMLGADSFDQVDGLCLERLILPEYRDAFRQVLDQAFQGQAASLEFEVETLGGRRLWLESHAVPLRNADEEIVASLKLTRDITEKKRAEQEMIKTQKLESLGIMAGGIAHDFNNLLTGILGGVSMVRTLLPRESGLDDILLIAEESCNRAKELSYRLLTFAKGGDPIRKPLLLRRPLMGATAMAFSGSTVAVSFDIADDLLPVRADESQLLQVFSNIALNARDALGPRAGSYLVRAANLAPTEQDAGPMVRLTFTDNGPGIPADILDKIFDPYFSTKGLGATKGQGLGLTICHSIVKKHEGRIMAESSPGQGTTITVELPAIAPIVKPAPGPLAKKRVLIMDDEAIFQRVVTDMLTHSGYEALAVPTSEAALAALQQSIDEGRPFQVALLDLTIPGGLGGLETVGPLTNLWPELKCVITSGYINSPILNTYQEHGFEAALAKPFSLDQLIRLLERLLPAED